MSYIELPHEYQTILSKAVACGTYHSQDEALRRALELLQDEANFGPALSSTNESRDWASRLSRWAESHSPTTHVVSDDRDSIYPDFGVCES